jgi:glucose-6-phosphate 1-dehydrogenase
MENHADLLVIFGITGDLARRMTFRALYRLERRGLLDGPIIGVASDNMTTGELVKQAREAIGDSGQDVDDAVFDRLARRMSYLYGSWGPDGAESLVRGHPRWQPLWLPADD